VIGSLNWSVIEVGTALICASLSALRPLVTRFLPGLFSQFTLKTGDARQGTLQVTDVEAGTDSIRYGSAHDSTASFAALRGLRKDADYQLQYLEQNNQPKIHDAIVTYISASNTTSKGTNLDGNTEKGNGILATTIVTQEVVGKN
jgi:hypothetical protein